MKKISILFYILLFSCAGGVYAGPIEDWQIYAVQIRDGLIPRAEAQARLAPLVAALSSHILANYDLHTASWFFPVKGYDMKAMDRPDFIPRSYYGAYRTRGYDFFDGDRHIGHPAYDISIIDKNRDMLDDRTRKPVEAVAMVDAVVVSTNEGWKPGSAVLGGNYVWLYNPTEKYFFCYAHLDKIEVQPGQLVRGDQALGTVGRSGALAPRHRSLASRRHTHLHLMVLEYKEGKLVPYDYSGRLKKQV